MLASVSCSTRPEDVDPIQLLASLPDAEIESVVSERPSGLRPSRRLPTPHRRHLARLARTLPNGGSDERLCLVGPAGSTYRFTLTIPPESQLRVGVSVVGEAPGPRGVPVRVRIESDGEGETLVEKALGRGGTPGWEGWSDSVVDLTRWADRIATLEITSEAESGPAPWVAWSDLEIRPRRVAADDWNVVLVSLDTLRADHLGSYGHDRPTSPFLDELVARSWRFASAAAHSPWTRPSHRALMTGLHPLSTGAAPARHLAERLAGAGFRTDAWTGGGQMDPTMGFGRGFDRYRVVDWVREPERWEEDLATLRGGGQLLFLHTYEIHDPYVDDRFTTGLESGRLKPYFDQATARGLGELTEDEKRWVEALYDGGVAFTDERLRALFERIDDHLALDRTIVVVTSDHGEEFWEHDGWRHGQSVYQHQLHVPLFLHVPAALRRRHGIAEGAGVVSQPVRLIDVTPTLLELLGIEPDPAMQGRSLLPLLRGERLPRAITLAEDIGPKERESKSVRDGDLKLVRTQYFEGELAEAAPDLELYDLGADPEEQHDLAGELPADRDRLDALLSEWTGERWTPTAERPDAPADPEGELDPRLRERLEALGYVN